MGTATSCSHVPQNVLNLQLKICVTSRFIFLQMFDDTLGTSGALPYYFLQRP